MPQLDRSVRPRRHLQRSRLRRTNPLPPNHSRTGGPVGLSHSTYAALSSTRPSSRETSRRLLCCPSTLTLWNGSLATVCLCHFSMTTPPFSCSNQFSTFTRISTYSTGLYLNVARNKRAPRCQQGHRQYFALSAMSSQILMDYRVSPAGSITPGSTQIANTSNSRHQRTSTT